MFPDVATAVAKLEIDIYLTLRQYEPYLKQSGPRRFLSIMLQKNIFSAN